jgi:hypothetical protein
MSNDVSTNEIDRINELADELNDEAADVLEYQLDEAASLGAVHGFNLRTSA